MRNYLLWLTVFLLLGILLSCGEPTTSTVHFSVTGIEKVSEVKLATVLLVKTDNGVVAKFGNTATPAGVLWGDDENVIVGPSPIVWVRGDDVKVLQLPESSPDVVFGVVPWVLKRNLYVYVPRPAEEGLYGAVYKYDGRRWQKLYTFSSPCDFLHATVYDGVVYFYGGRCGVLRLDDGKLADIGNLSYSAGVVFNGDMMFILAELASPTVYSYDLRSGDISQVRVFKNTHDISWIGVCGFSYKGRLPIFLLEKYEGEKYYLYAYDAIGDKLFDIGQIDDDVGWYNCLPTSSEVYLIGDKIYRIGFGK